MCNQSSKTAIRLFFLCILAWSQALYAQTYPSQPIKLIVAFTPGTGTDILARILAIRLGEELGVPVMVDNRAGAGGTLGTQSLVKSAPDGYTLILATNATLITAPLLVSSPPYRVEKDFTAIGGVARTPLVVVTGQTQDSPKTFKELVARARDKQTSFSSAGIGTIGHLTSEVLVKKMDMQSNHIPYKGSAQSLTDVARGEILFSSDTPPAVLPLISGAKLKALAVTGDKRLQAFPDVPTLQESGLPGVRLEVWWALMAPAGLSQSNSERLSQALSKAIANPGIRKKMQELELEPMPYNSVELTNFIRSENPFWQQFLSKSGIRLPE
jgi:tripartite-type tricarboxylate transporter receptor subunit TctC